MHQDRQEEGHRPTGGKTKTGEGTDSQGREITSQKAQGEEKSYNNIVAGKALCGQKQRDDETEEKKVGRKGTEAGWSIGVGLRQLVQSFLTRKGSTDGVFI